jgi:vitamin B12 transporter
MKKTLMASALALAFAHSAFSADNILLNDIIVTASRVPQTREALIADVSVIDTEEIQRAGQSTLIELLQRQPSIEITNNGGPGKASGVFIRGTNTNHVVLLIDGVSVQSATLGSTSFENLPTR